MALEQVFESTLTLTKLRSSPLGKLLEGFCQWLVNGGFSHWTIRHHLAHLSHLNEYLKGETNTDKTRLSADDVDGFFKAYPSLCRSLGRVKEHLCRVRFSVNRFVEYLSQEGLYDPHEQSLVGRALSDSYLEWLRDYQHTAPGTLKLRRNYLGKFLAWLGPQPTEKDLSELTAERVEEFFITYSQQVSKASRRSMQSTLRTFFRFCFSKGYTQQHLDRAVPTLRTYKLSTVPRGLSEEQAQKVLQSVDRSTDVGRRDFAILQLLHTYGVRGGQVCALRLDEINWAENKILFKASKKGKDSLLPLTAEVGESLLDYLRRARPTCCSYPQVFLTSRAPYHPLNESKVVSEIVRRRICAVDIELASKGAHAFRHGFATRMVHQGHSLKAVADVLGHRHLTTTFIYSKVDCNSLRQVALEWPQEV
jgi:site-specific recombinase XerD